MRLLLAFVLAAGCGGAATTTSPKGDAADAPMDGASTSADGPGSSSGADGGLASDDGSMATAADSGDAEGKDGGAAAKSASLSWNIPATYTDGTKLVVAGYHVYYGTASRVYGTPIDVKTATSYLFKPTSAAKYYFAVTAYDSSGSESAPSDEVSKALE